MDLSVYSLSKITKEKRERQPNWTEPEKQLLLSLTRVHRSILENKGSDTMTIKRKSQAWDEIAVHMKAAGYNRSKDRLKQQLGRIRAAGAKRAKEAMEKGILISTSNSCSSSFTNNPTKDGDLHRNEERDGIQIKLERIGSADDDEIYDSMTENPQAQLLSMPFNGGDILAVNGVDKNKATEQSVPSFMVKNVRSLNGTINYSDDIFHKVDILKSDMPANVKSASDIHFDNKTTNLVISNVCSNTKDRGDTGLHLKKDLLDAQREQRRSVRFTGTRTSYTREQRCRQIHMYRVSVERERLRGLKLQQKHERILHRKDVQIQNLKLQILRNLTNQNSDGNCINF